MANKLNNWYQTLFIDSEIWTFALTLTIGYLFVTHFSHLLMPALIALGFAYLFNGPLEWLCDYGVPRLLAVWLVFIAFVGIMGGMLAWLLPMLSTQSQNLFHEMPDILSSIQQTFDQLTANYPGLFSAQELNQVVERAKSGLGTHGASILVFTFNAIPSLIQGIIYFVLVPMLVFFYLKDKQIICGWFNQLLPKRRRLLTHVTDEVNTQLGHYVQGKIIELSLVALVSSLSFSVLGLRYSLLLGLLAGLSVVIPVVGVLLISIPVISVGLWQWGLSQPFYTLLIVYTAIQIIDGNLLVPLLFSEALNLHPIAIIIAILFFGGVFGFWGIFFAIPLATVVKALINVWLTETA